MDAVTLPHPRPPRARPQESTRFSHLCFSSGSLTACAGSPEGVCSPDPSPGRHQEGSVLVPSGVVLGATCSGHRSQALPSLIALPPPVWPPGSLPPTLPALGPGAMGCDSPPLPHEGPTPGPPEPAQPFCAAAGGPSTSLPRPSVSVGVRPVLHGRCPIRLLLRALTHHGPHPQESPDATQPSCWASWKLPSPHPKPSPPPTS